MASAGKAAVEETLPDHLATEEALLADLTPADRTTLAELLARLLRSAGSD